MQVSIIRDKQISAFTHPNTKASQYHLKDFPNNGVPFARKQDEIRKGFKSSIPKSFQISSTMHKMTAQTTTNQVSFTSSES